MLSVTDMRHCQREEHGNRQNADMLVLDCVHYICMEAFKEEWSCVRDEGTLIKFLLKEQKKDCFLIITKLENNNQFNSKRS